MTMQPVPGWTKPGYSQFGMDWAAFYIELYTRLELDEYLPKVLAELS